MAEGAGAGSTPTGQRTVVYLPSWQRAGKVSWCALRTFSMSSPTSGDSGQLSEHSGLGTSFFFLFRSFRTAVGGHGWVREALL